MPETDLLALIPGALIALALLAAGAWALHSVWNDESVRPPVKWIALLLLVLVFPISGIVWLIARPILDRTQLRGARQYR